jgi:hypothetical protein
LGFDWSLSSVERRWSNKPETWHKTAAAATVMTTTTKEDEPDNDEDVSWMSGVMSSLDGYYIPTGFPVSTIFNLLQPKQVDCMYLTLFLALLVSKKKPSASDRGVPVAFINDGHFKGELKDYLEAGSTMHPVDEKYRVMLAVYENHHYYMMDVNAEMMKVTVFDNSVTELTQNSITKDMLHRAYHAADAVDKAMRGGEESHGVSMTGSHKSRVYYGGSSAKLKQRRKKWSVCNGKPYWRERREIQKNACICYTAFDMCKVLTVETHGNGNGNLREWFVGWLVRETAAAYASGMMTAGEGSDTGVWKTEMKAWIQQIPWSNEVPGNVVPDSFYREDNIALLLRKARDGAPGLAAPLAIEGPARALEKTPPSTVATVPSTEVEAGALSPAAVDKKTPIENNAASIKHHDAPGPTALMEVEEEARVLSPADAVDNTSIEETAASATKRRKANLARLPNGDNATGPNPNAANSAKIPRHDYEASLVPVAVYSPVKAPCSTDDNAPEEEQATSTAHLAFYNTEHDTMMRQELEDISSFGQNVEDRRVANNVSIQVGSNFVRDVGTGDGEERGVGAGDGVTQAPTSPVGRNRIVDPCFDPTLYGGVALPLLEDLKPYHVGVRETETLSVHYFWYGAMLFACYTTEKPEEVIALLKEKFYPVAPTQPIICPTCAQRFFNPIQAKGHQERWETNGMCDPNWSSMQLAFGPSAFLLPNYLIDFLKGWRYKRLDLLDACRYPLVISGKQGASMRGYLPMEIAKEKHRLVSHHDANGLVDLLKHKSSHFWSPRVVGIAGKARGFGPERFHFFPEIPHLCFMCPVHRWSPDLVTHFFAEYYRNPDDLHRFLYMTRDRPNPQGEER